MLGWEDHVGAQVEARKMLQEGRGAAFRDPRFAVHDEILSEAYRVRAAAKAREHDARVTPNVLHLLMQMQVT